MRQMAPCAQPSPWPSRHFLQPEPIHDKVNKHIWCTFLMKRGRWGEGQSFSMGDLRKKGAGGHRAMGSSWLLDCPPTATHRFLMSQNSKGEAKGLCRLGVYGMEGTTLEGGRRG